MIRKRADFELAEVRDAVADLVHICSDPEKARRYFTTSESAEIDQNEFNLNVPRYVDTFEPEEQIDLLNATRQLADAKSASDKIMSELNRTLGAMNSH